MSRLEQTKLCFALGALIFNAAPCASEDLLEPKYQAVVRPVVKAFSADDREYIVKHTQYPLKRRYPIPAIQSAREFRKRFDQVFDRDFMNAVGRSFVRREWEAVGDR